ncbi:MAG: glycosyltransferase family 2 protein [Suipraeoptans sp.]
MVSIIVPIFNTDKYLERCIKSIINQSYKEWELILVDDGSTDDSAAICKTYEAMDDRIQYLFQQNKGVSYARNLGIEHAAGKYISFIDSDDDIMPNMLEVLIQTMNHEKPDMIYFNCKVVAKRKKDEWNPNVIEGTFSLPSIKERTEFILSTFLNYGISFSVWNKLYIRSLLEQHEIRFDEKTRIGEDIGFNTKYPLYARKITGIPDVLYTYRRRDNSAMAQYQEDKLCINDFSLMLENIEKQYLKSGGTKSNFNLIFIKTMDNQYYQIKDRKFYERYVHVVENKKFLLKHTIFALIRPWKFLRLFQNSLAKRKWKDHLYIFRYLVITYSVIT